MIRSSELIEHALKIVGTSTRPTEVELRLAVSAAYYGLFHLLGTAANAAIAGDDAETRRRLSRLYDHATFKKVCRDLQEHVGQRSEAGKAMLASDPDPGLVLIAKAFMTLAADRETAKYDLAADITPSYAIERVQLAAEAARAFAGLASSPETRRFLLALVLADRWPRRG